MKKILLLSDTHGYLHPGIEKHARAADEVWHAGDIGTLQVTDTLKQWSFLRAVYGNIDGTEVRREFPETLRFVCEEVTIFITHIGGYPGKYAPGIQELLAIQTPQLFICGHSHILKVQYDKNLQLLHLNPGAAGRYGMHTKKTLLRFCIDSKIITNLEVIELAG